MTTLEFKLDLPSRFAREVEEAGLLTPMSIKQMLHDALRQRAAQSLITAANNATTAGSEAMTMEEIQSEVNEVRAARKARRKSH